MLLLYAVIYAYTILYTFYLFQFFNFSFNYHMYCRSYIALKLFWRAHAVSTGTAFLVLYYCSRERRKRELYIVFKYFYTFYNWVDLGDSQQLTTVETTIKEETNGLLTAVGRKKINDNNGVVGVCVWTWVPC